MDQGNLALTLATILWVLSGAGASLALILSEDKGFFDTTGYGCTILIGTIVGGRFVWIFAAAALLARRPR